MFGSGDEAGEMYLSGSVSRVGLLTASPDFCFVGCWQLDATARVTAAWKSAELVGFRRAAGGRIRSGKGSGPLQGMP
jgi:hypothetical protein